MIGKKTVKIECDYHEVEKLIQETYRIKEYNLPYSEEIRNDSSMTVSVDGNLTESDKEKIRKFLRSKGEESSFMTQALMNDLCLSGKIEAGEYLINICW
jgi:hypothetical protein